MSRNSLKNRVDAILVVYCFLVQNLWNKEQYNKFYI